MVSETTATLSLHSSWRISCCWRNYGVFQRKITATVLHARKTSQVGVQDVGTWRTKWLSLWLTTCAKGQKILTKRNLMLVPPEMLSWKWPQPFQQEKKSQSFCGQLLYISSIGGALETKRDLLHWYSPNEQGKELPTDGWERIEDQEKRVFWLQSKPGRQHHCEVVWQQSCEPALFFSWHRTLGNVRHWDRKAKTHIMVPRPDIVDTTSSWEALTFLVCYLRCINSALDPEGGTCTLGGTLLQLLRCPLKCERMASIISQNGKWDSDASTAQATVPMSTVRNAESIFAWTKTETVFMPITTQNEKKSNWNVPLPLCQFRWWISHCCMIAE